MLSEYLVCGWVVVGPVCSRLNYTPVEKGFKELWRILQERPSGNSHPGSGLWWPTVAD